MASLVPNMGYVDIPNKHIKTSSQSQTFSTKGLKPAVKHGSSWGVSSDLQVCRRATSAHLASSSGGSPGIMWMVSSKPFSKCSGFWKTVVDHVALCYYFAEFLWDFFDRV